MIYTIRTVTPATFSPVSLDEAKAHVRRLDSDEDDLIAAQLAAAVDHVERLTSQVLADRVMEIAWPDFPCFPELLSIPREPVTEIVSLTYADSDGADVIMPPADYRWTEAAADVVLPAFRQPWPSASGEAGSVRLRFRTGYGEGLAPPALLAAVRLMLGHLISNREQVVTGTIATEMPLGVERLCAPFRRISL